jgi:two-component system sensor histidine kinase KdpD
VSEGTVPADQTSNRLQLLLGATIGVGKTVAMLHEGQRRRAAGADVVVALVETHGRAETEAAIGDLEVLPRHPVPYHGVAWPVLDVDGIVARRPDVALVDELAHRNPPTWRHPDRWEDVAELLDAGITVVTTVNIRQLQTVAEIAAGITGTPPRAVVPDEFVRRGDVALIDTTAELLRQRVAAGLIVAPDRADAALSYAFRPDRIAALRELALLWLADRVEAELEEYLARHTVTRVGVGRERVVVGVSAAVNSARVIDRAAQLARRMLATLHGVHVVPDDGLAHTTPSTLADHRARLEAEGAELSIVRADSVAAGLTSAVERYNATQLVVGAPSQRRLVSLASGSLLSLVRHGIDCDLHVVARPTGPPKGHGG